MHASNCLGSALRAHPRATCRHRLCLSFPCWRIRSLQRRPCRCLVLGGAERAPLHGHSAGWLHQCHMRRKAARTLGRMLWHTHVRLARYNTAKHHTKTGSKVKAHPKQPNGTVGQHGQYPGPADSSLSDGDNQGLHSARQPLCSMPTAYWMGFCCLPNVHPLQVRQTRCVRPEGGWAKAAREREQVMPM